MPDALSAHRSQHHTGESSTTTAANDQQVGTASRMNEGLCFVPGNDFGPTHHLLVFAEDVRNETIELGPGPSGGVSGLGDVEDNAEGGAMLGKGPGRHNM